MLIFKGNALGPCSGNKCKASICDSQIAFAAIRRVGAGGWKNAGGVTIYGAPVSCTGPLVAQDSTYNNMVDTVYLNAVGKLLWADPFASQQNMQVVFDPNFGDMSAAIQTSWDGTPNYSVTNVAPQWPPPALVPGVGRNMWWTAFPSTAPSGFGYSRQATPAAGQQNLITTVISGDTVTITGNSYLAVGGTTIYGFTLTWTLSNPMAIGDWGTILNTMLATMTFLDGTLNPTKTYPNANGTNYLFRLMSEIPVTPGSPPNNMTNALIVTPNRPGYSYALVQLNPEHWQFLANTTSGQTGGLVSAQEPICANCCPCSGLATPTNNTLGGSAPTYIGDVNIFGLAPYLFSAASLIKAASPLPIYAQLSLWDTVNNVYTREPCITLPSALGQHLFVPGDVDGDDGGPGCITALYNVPTQVAVSTGADAPTNPGRTELNVGQSATFYAVSLDKTGNYIRNVAATWSLTINEGSASQWSLVPASDGMSAVLTALSGAAFSSFCTVNVSATGLTGSSGGGGILV